MKEIEHYTANLTESGWKQRAIPKAVFPTVQLYRKSKK